ncbi:tissue factor-like [Solea senegalensis]|uniref:Tissue factor n=1 Tax=Solea senegalensis TaxID=28829 RepID=A0AAV6PQR1_SOLSE|nr:tissue factor-like [Solea senegalensis]KAG7471748.1 tissue factor-like [Solea senegalensis]
MTKVFCHVTFSDDSDWLECYDCSQVSETECDMTNSLRPFDKTYHADIQTEHVTMDYNSDPEELTHTYSPKFNPHKQSNISAVKFTVAAKDERTVIVNITDPLTSIHDYGKQLTIRDILKNDLKYKISYYKSGSTGKRDVISNSSVAEVSQLDAGESYCFMVAAFIPSRPKSTQQGAWSKQLCNQVHKTVLQELSVGAWVGAVFIVLTVVIVIVTVTVLCCKRRKQRNKAPYTAQLSAPA